MNIYLDQNGSKYAANSAANAGDCLVPFPSPSCLAVLSAKGQAGLSLTQAQLDAACLVYSNSISQS